MALSRQPAAQSQTLKLIIAGVLLLIAAGLITYFLMFRTPPQDLSLLNAAPIDISAKENQLLPANRAVAPGN